MFFYRTTFFESFSLTAQSVDFFVMSKTEGYLYKLGEKGLIKTWKNRYFEIKDYYVYYYKNKGGSEIGKIDLKLGKHSTSFLFKKYIININSQ